MLRAASMNVGLWMGANLKDWQVRLDKDEAS